MVHLALIVPIASNQGGLGALIAIGLLLAYCIAMPLAGLAAAVAIAWNLFAARLGGIGVAVQALVVLGNLGVAAMGLALAITVIDAPGVEILIGALCTSVGCVAAAGAVAVTAVRARTSD